MGLGKFALMTAAIVTTAAATFNLTASSEDGPLNLQLAVDGDADGNDTNFGPNPGSLGAVISVEFVPSMFANIAAATAAEVAAALNAAFVAQAAAGQPAALTATVSSNTVVIATVGLGASWSLEVNEDSTALTALGLTAGEYYGTGAADIGAMPSAPIFHNVMTFAGDSAYPTGGSPGFGAAVAAFFKDGRQVLAVVSQDCGGYTAVYVPATDSLKVYQNEAIDTPQSEVAAATNLSSVTFNVLVLSS